MYKKGASGICRQGAAGIDVINYLSTAKSVSRAVSQVIFPKLAAQNCSATHGFLI
jgi:hypothetical protein